MPVEKESEKSTTAIVTRDRGAGAGVHDETTDIEHVTSEHVTSEHVISEYVNLLN